MPPDRSRPRRDVRRNGSHIGALRSKNGCSTCKRRKVRCNEQQPRCNHCTRLDLDCEWHDQEVLAVTSNQQRSTLTVSSEPQSSPSLSTIEATSVNATEDSLQTIRSLTDLTAPASAAPISLQQDAQSFHDPNAPSALDACFDYTEFMGTGGDWWKQMGADLPSDLPISLEDQPVVRNHNPAPLPTAMTLDRDCHSQPPLSLALESTCHNFPIQTSALGEEDKLVLDNFQRSKLPPILAAVETQQRWDTIRKHLLSTSTRSDLLRSAILTFANLSMRHSGCTTLSKEPNEHYDVAATALEFRLKTVALHSHNPERESIIASCFFLTYVDILGGRIELAQHNLSIAYHIFQTSDKKGLRPIEARILSWIRLLDAKAVAAGGQGLFLSNNAATDMLTQASPLDSAGFDTDARTERPATELRSEVEDCLLQTLCQPGTSFFQQVQSFMGRISSIDPWHRSRGTVADEFEVMNIASTISRDLDQLYEERPRIMDFALAGQVTLPILNQRLSHTMTRVFRTYACSYHACKVHLHRVAYKALPLASGTEMALSKIKELSKLIAHDFDDFSDPGRIIDPEPLPASLIWPLMMWGAEEKESDEREWIRHQINCMGRVATNARMSAHVLDEVQRRQDQSQIRIDIRSVMHDIFDAGFAVM